MNRNCISCAYFEIDRAMSGQNVKGGLVGGCHRFPPSTQIQNMGGGQSGIKTTFPIVMESQWCGEYVPRIEMAVGVPTKKIGEAK